MRKTTRKVRDVPDVASCSVKRTITPAAGGNYVTNTMYDIRDMELAAFERAGTIATGYQHFRIKKLTLTLKPVYDTYQQGVGLASRPNIYYMIDKSGAVPTNATLETLKQMGAKAHRFDEKPFTISWRPSVLTADQTAIGVVGSSQYKISPWLSTNARPNQFPWLPSTVDHLGIFWYVEQLFGGGTQYNAEIEAQFEFKKPLWEPPESSSPLSQKSIIAIQDASSDGIKDGPDANNAVPRPS